MGICFTHTGDERLVEEGRCHGVETLEDRNDGSGNERDIRTELAERCLVAKLRLIVALCNHGLLEADVTDQQGHPSKGSEKRDLE